MLPGVTPLCSFCCQTPNTPTPCRCGSGQRLWQERVALPCIASLPQTRISSWLMPEVGSPTPAGTRLLLAAASACLCGGAICFMIYAVSHRLYRCRSPRCVAHVWSPVSMCARAGLWSCGDADRAAPRTVGHADASIVQGAYSNRLQCSECRRVTSTKRESVTGSKRSTASTPSMRSPRAVAMAAADGVGSASGEPS